MRKLITTVFAIALSVGIFAQQSDTMFVHTTDQFIHEFPTAKIDSIIFQRTQPPMTLPKDTVVMTDTIIQIQFDTVTLTDTVIRIDTVVRVDTIFKIDTVIVMNYWNVGELGIASFATDQTWTFYNRPHNIHQVWSDAVQTTVCSNKTTFSGGTASAGFNIDCRSNPNFRGDLFSWRAVNELNLCPYPWRVPTRQDFRNLDIGVMGGNGNDRRASVQFITDIVNLWGGEFVGRSTASGSLTNQNTTAHYWGLGTQQNTNDNSGHSLIFDIAVTLGDNIRPMAFQNKGQGQALRCVKDISIALTIDETTGCDIVPNWGETLGTVSFATNETWAIGNQIWSDAVQTTVCSNKTSFHSGNPGIPLYRSDCRSNPGQLGDLFSWCAVMHFGDLLCPYPWRVPILQDFIDLDKSMGGCGNIGRADTPQFVQNNFITRWGGTFSGSVTSDFYSNGGRIHQGINARYWALSTDGSTASALLFCHAGSVSHSTLKFVGKSLRCVRNP